MLTGVTSSPPCSFVFLVSHGLKTASHMWPKRRSVTHDRARKRRKRRKPVFQQDPWDQAACVLIRCLLVAAGSGRTGQRASPGHPLLPLLSNCLLGPWGNPTLRHGGGGGRGVQKTSTICLHTLQPTLQTQVTKKKKNSEKEKIYKVNMTR